MAIAPIIFGRQAPSQPTGWAHALGQLITDAYRFFTVSDKIVRGAIERAQTAPLGRRAIVPIHQSAIPRGWKHTACPVRPVGYERPRVISTCFCTVVLIGYLPFWIGDAMVDELTCDLCHGGAVVAQTGEADR